MSEPIVARVAATELSGEARKLYEQFTSHDKPVPKWMQVMANCDDILVGFFAMFKATMDDAPLPSVLKWKVANEVSKINKCEFCIDVANAKLRQFGLDDTAIERIEEEADEREKVAIAFARAVTEKAYEIDPAVTAAAKEHFNDEELVELTAVIGLFNYINRFNDALGVFPG
ncbi:carboxymuconolactone decarboxylase family protein [Candidatus Nomurabacteria bacterium]|nr:carboxymuconolactone decarboxylase family protein [Candidatus Nomurabacteria bacterium]